jgi:hypothetical protein
MTISPTLGISNQYNPGPMEQYAAIASQGLQQLGAQVQQDITTIQTNQQLKSLANDLQGIDPTDTTSPKFGSQMTQAVLNNPLAAHSPVGMQAINQLGASHQAALLSATRLGVANIGAGARVDSAGIGAASRESVAGINAQSRADANGNRPHILRPGDKAFDPQGNLIDENPADAPTVKPTIIPSGGMAVDADGNVIAQNLPAPKPKVTPPDVVKANEDAEKEYANAQAKSTQADIAHGANPNDSGLKANAAGAKSLLDAATVNVQRTRNVRAQYESPRPPQSPAGTSQPISGGIPAPSGGALPVDTLGKGAAPTAPAIPAKVISPADKQLTIQAAKDALVKSPSQRALIVDRLRSAGISDLDMLNSGL